MAACLDKGKSYQAFPVASDPHYLFIKYDEYEKRNFSLGGWNKIPW